MSSKEYRQLHKEETKVRNNKYHKEHKEKENERSRIYYNLHKEELKPGMAIRSKKHHQEHREEDNKKNQVYYQEHKMEILERNHKHNIEKAPQISAQKSAKNKAAKLEILTHYGNGKLACVKCGYSDIRALSIDHIDGSGAEKRDVRRSTGVNLYGWLKRNGFPEGYQTLCMSCQAEKKILNKEQTRGKTLNPKYAQQRYYQAQLKFDAINKYSGGRLTCIKCGCNNMDTLSIDHVNGDGAQHKRERGMDNLYLWLRNNNYPNQFQCICMNCQYIKRSENNEHTKPKKKKVMLLV